MASGKSRGLPLVNSWSQLVVYKVRMQDSARHGHVRRRESLNFQSRWDVFYTRSLGNSPLFQVFWLVHNYINYVIVLMLVSSNIWKMLNCIWLPSTLASMTLGHVFRDMISESADWMMGFDWLWFFWIRLTGFEFGRFSAGLAFVQ